MAFIFKGIKRSGLSAPAASPSRPAYSASRPLGHCWASVFSLGALGKLEPAPYPAPCRQLPTRVVLCRETSYLALHRTEHKVHSSKRPRAACKLACDLTELCTKKFRVSVRPNSHCFSQMCTPKSPDPFENTNLKSLGPYIHTCKHTKGNGSIHVRNEHLFSFSLGKLVLYHQFSGMANMQTNWQSSKNVCLGKINK